MYIMCMCVPGLDSCVYMNVRISYNYYTALPVTFMYRHSFTKNVDDIHRKCQPRLYCLHKLRNIGIDSKILQMYCKCCIESLLTVSFICWYGSLCVRSKRVLGDVGNIIM